MESRFQRDSQNTTLQPSVNTQPRNFYRPGKQIFRTLAEAFPNETLVRRQLCPRLHKFPVFAGRCALLTMA
jgi:hypothetical protein